MSKITVAFPLLSFLGRAEFGKPIKKLNLTFHKLIVMLLFIYFFVCLFRVSTAIRQIHKESDTAFSSIRANP